MIGRRLRPYIEDRLKRMPGIGLLWPRQVGKTTLARTTASRKAKSAAVYLDLEDPSTSHVSTIPTHSYGHKPKLVLINESHRAPALFETLRGIIDDGRAAGKRGHFRLLGSAAIELMRQASESLTGRVAGSPGRRCKLGRLRYRESHCGGRQQAHSLFLSDGGWC